MPPWRSRADGRMVVNLALEGRPRTGSRQDVVVGDDGRSRGMTQPRVLDVATLIYVGGYGLLATIGAFGLPNEVSSFVVAAATTAGLSMLGCAVLTWRRQSASQWSGWLGLVLGFLLSASPESPFRAPSFALISVLLLVGLGLDAAERSRLRTSAAARRSQDGYEGDVGLLDRATQEDG